jgi:hypothetical protein
MKNDVPSLSYDDLYDYYNLQLHLSGIDSKYTMKSIRKRFATREYIKHVKDSFA